MTPPLKGVRVVELTHTILGPSCGMILADLGAEVIKVEPVDGDRTRKLRGFAAGFFSYFNRNKRSLCLDLKAPEGLAIAQDMIRKADVLLENFGPGTLDRMGLGWEDVHKVNPRRVGSPSACFVYCVLACVEPSPFPSTSLL